MKVLLSNSQTNTLFRNILKAGREGDDRGWDVWMASPTQWTWVRVNSGSRWWTGRPGVLQSLGSQRVGHDWATELNWTELNWTESKQHGTGWKWPNISVEQNRGPRSKSIYSQLVYNRGGKKLCWRKDSIFDKWCWEIWMATFLKMGLEHFLTPYTNINSK